MGFLSALCILFVFYRVYRKTKENNIDNNTNTATFNRIKKKEYKPPVITCDYCGSKVDTAVYDRCPNCGASYDLDSEWINRFDSYEEESDYNQNYNSSNTGSIYQRTFQNYGPNKVKQKKSNGVKRAVIYIAVIIVLIIAIPIVYYIIEDHGSYYGNNFRSDEELNEYSYDAYQPVDYEIVGDGQILNYNLDDDPSKNVTVTLKNIYKNSGSFGSGYKAEFEVVNNSDEDLKIVFTSSTINNYTDSDEYIYAYDSYKKHSTVTVYESFSGITKSEIKNISFERCEILTLDSDSLYTSNSVTTINTSSTIELGYDLSRYHVIYSNDYVDIYSVYDHINDMNQDINYDSGLKYYIVNKTDEYTFDIDCGDYLCQGKSLYTYGMYNCVLAPGVTLLTSEIYSYDDLFKNVKNQELYISFTFKCREKPSMGFTTDYIDLKTEYWKSEG